VFLLRTDSNAVLAVGTAQRPALITTVVADVVADVPCTAQEYDRFLAEGTWEGEVGLRTSDGSTLRVNSLARTLTTSDGRLLHEAVITPGGGSA